MAAQKLKVEHNYPVAVATDVAPRIFLTPGGTSALLGVTVATLTTRPHWHSNEGTTASGAICPALETGQVVKALAVASFAAGAEVGVASINGALGASLFAASGHWAVGIALTSPQAGGELFSLDFRPRKL